MLSQLKTPWAMHLAKIFNSCLSNFYLSLEYIEEYTVVKG